MVSRLEAVLIVAILFFAGKGVLTEIAHEKSTKVSHEKELEISQLVLNEVNQTALLHTITASRMIKYADETRYENFGLYTPDLRLLSPYAVAKQKKILLNYNATIIKKDGSRYHAGTVIYDTQSRRLNLTETFSMANRFGDINGTQMRYDANQKKIYGEGIRAAYELK